MPFLSTKATINDDGELVWSGTVETIEELYNDAAYGCNLSNNTGGAAFCTKIIQINGWVIPNDYPFKF